MNRSMGFDNHVYVGGTHDFHVTMIKMMFSGVAKKFDEWVINILLQI